MSRRWPIPAAAAILVMAAAVVLALFQPWKLWVDDKVDEAVPAGAVPITTPAATDPQRTSTPPTSASSTAPNTASAGPTASPATTDVAATTAPTTTAPTTVATDVQFISIDHDTSGTVLLLQDAAGAQFIRLESLDTTNGPDLFVYLSTNPPDGPEGRFDDDFVNLGRLEGNVGSSNYMIPAGTDVSRYASVVIWCDRFNSAFGAAPLT
ncbi:MAG: DM13 domain-containing protein [Acidimicrobiia bacterium]